MNNFLFTVLGTSSAVPTAKRYTSAHVLKIHEHLFLFDCGEGTQIRLRQKHISLSRINHIFISHLHGDHYFGIFGLLSSFQLQNRKHPLHIYAHNPLKSIVECVLNYNEHLPFELIFHELSTENITQIFENKHIIIFTFPLKHRIHSNGFVVQEKPLLRNVIKKAISEYNLSLKDIISLKKGEDLILPDGTIIPNEKLTKTPRNPKKFVYCGDTMYDESIIDIIKNADLVYHEATFTENFKDRALITGHSTAAQAASLAKKANIKKLVIGHFSIRYKQLDELLNEARAIFSETYLAEEGVSFSF